MRIIFEFTRVFIRPENNRGIARVIRNLGLNLHKVKEGIECIPVIQKNSIYYSAQTITYTSIYRNQISRVYLQLKHILDRMRYWHDSLRSKTVFKEACFSRLLLHFVYKIACKPVSFFTKSCAAVRIKITLRNLNVITMQKGDVLVWPNPFGNNRDYKRLSQLKAQGVYIVILVYDLFPITHPEWFPKNKSQKRSLLEMADGFMTISKTVRDELQEYIHKELSPRTSKEFWCDYFYLGAGLDRANVSIEPRSVLQRLLVTHSSIYLMVGAIHTNKNHAYVLDAFEHLWRDGKDVTLYIIGKPALKSSQIVERIKKHPQWGKRLFMWNDINDTELKSCYQHAKALIFPSLNEGFGLPLIEAMQYQLPVMASDIPIFREIGGDFVAYFSLKSPMELSRLVEEYENSSVFPAAKPVSGWKWFTWQDSACQLISKIKFYTEQQRHN